MHAGSPPSRGGECGVLLRGAGVDKAFEDDTGRSQRDEARTPQRGPDEGSARPKGVPGRADNGHACRWPFPAVATASHSPLPLAGCRLPPAPAFRLLRSIRARSFPGARVWPVSLQAPPGAGPHSVGVLHAFLLYQDIFQPQAAWSNEQRRLTSFSPL